MGVASNIQLKSPGNFKMNEYNAQETFINIHTCVDLQYLTKALGVVLTVKRQYEEAAAHVKLDKYPVCLYLNTSVENWISDLEFRVKIVANQAQINLLTARKNQLTQFLSEDQRLYETLRTTNELL